MTTGARPDLDAPPATDSPAPSATLIAPAAPATGADPLGAAVLVAVLAFTVPIAITLTLWSTPGGADDWTRRVHLAPFDFALGAALFWGARHRAAVIDLFRSRSVRLVSGAFIAAFLISLACNFSWLGVALGARLAGGLCAIAATAVAMSNERSRTIALGGITIAGLGQAVLGMAQSLHGNTFGIALVDFQLPLFQFGTSSAAQGGLPHPYYLAGFLVMAQGAALLGLRHATNRWPWLASLAVLSIGIAITYSRAAVLGQIGLVLCAMFGRGERKVLLAGAAAVCVGLAIGAVAFGDGWITRSETSVGRDDQSADSDRVQRLREAGDLIESSPIVGIGPGQYVEELHAYDLPIYQAAHNLFAHEAAELGIPGGLVTAALFGLLLVRARRGGAWTAMLVVTVIPLAVLGTVPYVLPGAMAVSGLWLGLVRGSLDADTAAP